MVSGKARPAGITLGRDARRVVAEPRANDSSGSSSVTWWIAQDLDNRVEMTVSQSQHQQKRKIGC